MKMKNIKTKIALVVIAAILVSGYVSAGSWLVTPSAVDTRWTEPSAGSDETEGGNITQLNLTSELLTQKWAAYYGNLTGDISLRDTTGYTVFNWSWTIGDGAEVCASTASSFNWTDLENATEAAVDANWSFAAGDVDSAANTFSLYTEDFTIAGVTVNNVPSFTTGPETANDDFETGVMGDGDNATKIDFVFCVNADAADCTGPGGCSYNNRPVNYELMVPTNEAAGATETFYFYVELN